MASAPEKGLAKKLLSLRSGGAVSNELAGAARRVLDGQARSTDMDAIRAYFNVGRSHAGKVRAMGSATRVGMGMLNVARDLSAAGVGADGAFARAGTQIAMMAAQEITKNRKALIKLGEGLAGTLRQDPALASRFVNGLARVAKLGGAVTAVGLVAYEAGNAFVGSLAAGAEAQKRLREAFSEFGNRKYADRVESKYAQKIVEEAVLGFAPGPNAPNSILSELNPMAHYNEWLQSRRENESGKRAEHALARAKAKRELVREYAGPALAREAARQGVAIDQLTERSVNKVLDEIGERDIRPSAQETLDYYQNRYNELGTLEQMKMRNKDTAAWRNAYFSQWDEELQDRAVKLRGRRKLERANLEQETWDNLSSTDRLKIGLARIEAAGKFSGYMTRHQAVILD